MLRRRGADDSEVANARLPPFEILEVTGAKGPREPLRLQQLPLNMRILHFAAVRV